MADVIRGIWSIFAFFPLYLGIFLVPATFYGVLECIKNAVQGKNVKEYMKPSFGHRSDFSVCSPRRWWCLHRKKKDVRNCCCVRLFFILL